MLFLIFKLSIDNKKCHNAINLYILIAILTLLRLKNTYLKLFIIYTNNE